MAIAAVQQAKETLKGLLIHLRCCHYHTVTGVHIDGAEQHPFSIAAGDSNDSLFAAERPRPS
jgi:hypothetical protein